MDTLTKFYEEYADSIYNYCYWRIRDKKEAEDLTAEAFLRFVRQNGLTKEFPKAYLYAICRNLLIDYFRAKKPAISLDVLLSSGFEPESKYDIEQQAELGLVYTEVESLPYDQREAIILRYQQDLDIKTISQILEKSEAAVKALLSRGLESIRKKLKV